MTDRPKYSLVVEALPSDVPAVVRLRRLLKYALRSCRLRCRRIEPRDAEGKR